MVGAKNADTQKHWNTQLDMELDIQEHVENLRCTAKEWIDT